MTTKSAVIAFRALMPEASIERGLATRRPTEAEREFVRAQAREAARAFVATELQQSAVRDEVEP
jgi:hypothetical protein